MVARINKGIRSGSRWKLLVSLVPPPPLLPLILARSTGRRLAESQRSENTHLRVESKHRPHLASQIRSFSLFQALPLARSFLPPFVSTNMHALSALVPIFLAAQALAHGYVTKLTIAGKPYLGNPPAESHRTSPSVIRQISNIVPILGANNPDIVCGPGSTPAALVADAMPGDKVTFTWSGAQGAPVSVSFHPASFAWLMYIFQWPHNSGPVLTYMASCGSTSCDKFNANNAKWFKIAQVGKKADGTWFQADVST